MLKQKLLGLVACSALAFAFAGCDDDEGGTTGVATATGTDGGSDSDESDSDESDSDESDSDESDSDESTTTDDPSTSTTGNDCSPDDPCQTDADCDMAAGESCIDCICFGGNSSDSDSDSDTDSGGSGDPAFPNPAGGCPMGYVDGNTATNPGTNLCIPACNPSAADAISACPQPATGTAVGVCNLTNPGGTPTMCTMDDAGMACGDVPDMGFYCLGNGAGGFECDQRVACLLVCPSGTTCPDGMTCGAGGVCEY